MWQTPIHGEFASCCSIVVVDIVAAKLRLSIATAVAMPSKFVQQTDDSMCRIDDTTCATAQHFPSSQEGAFQPGHHSAHFDCVT